jgi:hypothetical protein
MTLWIFAIAAAVLLVGLNVIAKRRETRRNAAKPRYWDEKVN